MERNLRDRSRDLQDSVERGVWGSQTYVAGSGSHMTIRGTGTLDQEVPVMQLGYGFNLPADSNAEVIMLALGSDPYDKVAFPTIPKDLQYQWGEGEGGIQHPTNPDRRIEFNANETHLSDGNYTVGPNKEVTITIAGGNVTIANANITLDGDVAVTGSLAVAGPNVTHGDTNIGNTHTHAIAGGLAPSVSGVPS